LTLTVDCGKGRTIVQLRDPNAPDFTIGLGISARNLVNSSASWHLISAKSQIASEVRSVFGRFTSHLASLAFEDEPNYGFLRNELREGLKIMVWINCFL
jgi:hypothetical protein